LRFFYVYSSFLRHNFVINSFSFLFPVICLFDIFLCGPGSRFHIFESQDPDRDFHGGRWVAKLVAHLVAKVQNGRHKQNSGQYTEAQKNIQKRLPRWEVNLIWRINRSFTNRLGGKINKKPPGTDLNPD
jgi:hypothetical protein